MTHPDPPVDVGVPPPPPEPELPDRLWHPGARAITAGTTALISLIALEYIAVGTAMPTVARALDGLPLYNLAFASTIAGSVIGMVLAGWWADHSGPGAVVRAGCSAFAAGLLIAGFAPTMEIFVTGRALQGIGSGLASVAIYVLIAQGLPDRLRPMMFSLLAAAWVVPGLAGPLLTGAAVQFVHWRAVFLGVVPLVLVAFLVLRPALRQSRPSSEPPYLTGAMVGWSVLAAVSVGLLNLGGERISTWEVAVGAPVVVLLVLASVHLLPPGTTTLRRGMPSVVATRAALGASFITAEAYLPLLLQELHGYGPALAGAVLAVGSITWAAGSFIQGRASEHVDRYKLLTLGGAVVFTGLGLLVASVALDWPGWTILLIWGYALIGVGLAYPTTSLLTLRLSPPEHIGRNSSALQVSEALASALALAAIGAAFTAWHGAGALTPAFLAVMVGATVAGACSVLTASRARP